MKSASLQFAVAAAALALSAPAFAEDTLVLGSAISITGKYSQEGKNAKDGYDFAVKAINDAGGVKVNGKTYKLEVKYYDDESTPARTSRENGSFSNAMPIFRLFGFLPFFFASSAARSITGARYCSEVESAAKMYR